nr:hypothetical protein [Tanacetum cinerariifolium]
MELSRSVLKELSRSVLKELSRSVPMELSRSVLKELSRSVPVELSRSVLKELSRSVPMELSRLVLKEPTRSVHPSEEEDDSKDLDKSGRPSYPGFREPAFVSIAVDMSRETAFGYPVNGYTNGSRHMEIVALEGVFMDKEVTRRHLEALEITDGDGGACECTLPTQGMGSIISMVSISPKGFLPFILLLVVVIVTVVIVAVILVVVAINGVVIVAIIIRVEVLVTIIGVVVVGGGVSFIIKPSLVIIASRSFSVFGTMFGHKVAISCNLLIPGDLVSLLYSNRFGIGIPPGQASL